MSASDPTMQLLADLDDPTKFRRVERVAVFRPHTREQMTADGKKRTIRVTGADLQTIAERTNAALEQSGRPVRLTLGHVKQDPNYPEHLQPKIVGFAKDYKAEVVQRPAGTLLTVTHTEYLRADEADEILRQYPFRSPEYDPEGQVFGGVALLTRDPWLDTGAVYVYAAGSRFIHYQAGTNMADDNDDKWTDDEEAQYAKVCRYMKKKYPRLASYMDDPSSTNTMPADAATHPASYQKAPEYAALEAENTRLVVERELDQLAYQGVRFDRAVELPKLVAMKPDDRPTHIAYMKAHYAKSPTGSGLIPLADGTPAAKKAAKDGPLTAAELPRVAAYQKTMPYEAAVAKVIAER